MKMKNNKLFLNQSELIEIINNNPDKKSKDIDNTLIRMINEYYGKFSVKQLKWITAKVNFIVRSNKMYKNYVKIKDIVLL